MIQELFGGATTTTGLLGSDISERKISIAEALLLQSSPHLSYPPNPCPPSFPLHISTTITPVVTKSTPSSRTGATTTTTTTPTTNSEAQNLKCPRCNSTNTKFCYYNNYNLTQPRHFCKTCRRYWTKGGALRNVPIGGGCRKNKCSSSLSSSSSAGKSSALRAKMALPLSSEFGRRGLIGNVFDQDLASSQMFWPSPQNSHILALLRAAQNPNPNLNTNMPSALTIKSEGMMMRNEDIRMMSPLMSVGSRGSEPYNNHASTDPYDSFKKNIQCLQHGILPREVQSSTIQPRPVSSSTYAYGNHPAAMVLTNNFGSNSSSSATSSSSIFEPSPVNHAGSDMSFINTSLSWANHSASHGAHP